MCSMPLFNFCKPARVPRLPFSLPFPGGGEQEHGAFVSVAAAAVR